MKRAKITSSGTIEWSEMCFCSTPLNHERTTVYDHYLRNLETRVIDNYTESDGESFFAFLEKQFQR